MNMSHEEIVIGMEKIIAEISEGKHDPEEQARLIRVRQRWDELQAKNARDELTILYLTEQRNHDDELFSAFIREMR
jgi:hypothetical protein